MLNMISCCHEPKQGILIPKEFFIGIQEVEIRQEAQRIVVIPFVATDPILPLGAAPLDAAISDASDIETKLAQLKQTITQRLAYRKR